jgi:hypothetical protein
MSFNAYIDQNSITSVAEAALAGYIFSMDIIYSEGDGVTSKSLRLLRYISEPIGSVDYVEYGSSIPGYGFNLVEEKFVTDVSGVISFSDDLSSIDPAIRSQIFDTNERYVAWTLLGEGSQGFGTCPYVFIANMNEGASCFSPRTQVLHNVLHIENEPIWSVNIPPKPGVGSVSMSRMAVDMHSLYTRPEHTGPNGIGGWFWVTDRNKIYGGVIRIRAKDGVIFHAYQIPANTPRGTALNPSTSEVFVGGDGSKIYRLTIDESNPENGTSSEFATNPFTVNDQCYGLTPVFGQPGVFYEVSWNAGVTKLDFSDLNNPNIQRVYNAGRGYGIVSDPFGNVYVSDFNQAKIVLVDGPNAQQTISTGGGTGGYYRGMTAEFPNTYPNDKDSFYMYCAASRMNCVYRWKVNRSGIVQGSMVAYPAYHPEAGIGYWPCGVGADSENNIYVVGQRVNKIGKIYRVENNENFPLGARCRYPATSINSFRNGITNTKEIEWFLLRDPDEMSAPAKAAYEALIETIDETYSENKAGISYTRRFWGIGVKGAGVQNKIDAVMNWASIYGEADIGRRVWPNYSLASDTGVSNNHSIPQNDKWIEFNFTPNATSGGYMYSDFTGNTLLQSLPIYLDGVGYSDVNPNLSFSTSSFSSKSSSTLSSKSSSTEILNIYDLTYATYASDCIGLESINNPLVGHEANMEVFGSFNEVVTSSGQAYEGDKIHISKGGLEKTSANGGAIFCDDASLLFDMKKGAVSMRFSLPDYDIIDGVYAGLSPSSEKTMSDFVLFGSNLGEFYTSPPGIYGALTKNGLEFSIITSGGKQTLLARGFDAPKGIDVVVDFLWDADGLSMPNEANMAIKINDAISVWGKAKISPDPISENYAGRKIPFRILDTPYGKSDLHIILRRVEIYSDTPKRARSRNEQSSSRTSESSQTNPIEIEKNGMARLDFDIFGVKGATVDIMPPTLHRVAIEDVDMRAVGPSGASIHKNGLDLGAEGSETLPAPLFDLPPGFTEVREPNE